MDPSNVNSFLDQFLAVASSGFGLIQGDVGYVLNVLIVISIVLAGLQWALGQDNPVTPMFRKVLFIGFFVFLLNNWDLLTTVIHRSGAMLGLQAGGGAMTMADLHNPGRIGQIGVDLFGRTAAMSEGMNIFSDAFAMATIWLAAVLVMLGFFVLALQLFVALIAFKLGALAAFVALPWGVFSGTAWVAERPLGWVAGSAVRLFVLALIASVSMSFVDTLPATFTLDAGGVLNVLLFGLTVLAMAWFGPMLASEVVQGQPHLSGSDAMRTGVGAAFTTMGAGFIAHQGVKGIRSMAERAQKFVGGVRPGARGGAGGGVNARGAGAAAINYGAMQPRPSPPGKGGKP